MITVEIKPIHERDKYSEAIADVIRYEIFQRIFKPLLNILDGIDHVEHGKNKGELISAFKSGRIWFDRGYVFGGINAVVGRELRSVGAKFIPSRKAYKIDLNQLPMEVRSAIAAAGEIKAKKEESVKKFLMETQNVPMIDFNAYSQGIIDSLNVQFKRVTPSSISVPMEMDETTRKLITEDYSKNLNLYIQGWSDDAILRLRQKVEENVAEGFRADKLKKIIMAEYSVSDRRAKFIARQETGLLVSKFRQTRYSQAGVTSYRWSTSHDERVRADHRALDKQVFTWDSPPIVNRSTGKRGHPGEDYQCRCVALPIIRGVG